jgi:hypothetical protein
MDITKVEEPQRTILFSVLRQHHLKLMELANARGELAAMEARKACYEEAIKEGFSSSVISEGQIMGLKKRMSATEEGERLARQAFYHLVKNVGEAPASSE